MLNHEIAICSFCAIRSGSNERTNMLLLRWFDRIAARLGYQRFASPWVADPFQPIVMDTKPMSMQDAPPTEHELAGRRRAAAATLVKYAQRERWFKKACYVLSLIGLAITVLLWQMSMHAVTVVFPDAVAAGFVAGGSSSGVVAPVIGIVIFWAVAAQYVHVRWIDAPRATLNAVLADLVELDHASHPDEYIAFVGFAETDDTVCAYQRQLAALGRKPVLAEYWAARDWMDSRTTLSAEQEKLDRDRQACSRSPTTMRGGGVLDLLALLALMTLVLWVGSSYLPAKAEDLQAVISLAEPSPAAKAVLVASLKDTPNPTRAQLHRIRVRVNEIVVSEMARSVTRDATIETPGQRNATPQLAASQPKSWMELSSEERAEFLASNWLIGVVLIAVVWFVGLSVWRALREAYNLLDR